MRCALFVVVALAGCIDDPDLSQESAAVQVCGGSIQAAINAAPQDAVLEICAGTYRERLTIDGKRLELRGAGASTTIIDATSGGRALVVRNSGGVTVTGLTLK